MCVYYYSCLSAYYKAVRVGGPGDVCVLAAWVATGEQKKTESSCACLRFRRFQQPADLGGRSAHAVGGGFSIASLKWVGAYQYRAAYS